MAKLGWRLGRHAAGVAERAEVLVDAFGTEFPAMLGFCEEFSELVVPVVPGARTC